MIFAKNKERNEFHKENKMKRSIQTCIPYEKMFSNGICKNKEFFNAMIKIDDISYQLDSEDSRAEKYSAWMELLNGHVPKNGSFQIFILNRKIDRHFYEENIFLQSNNDGLDHYRKEMNNVLKENLHKGNSNIISEKYLLFSTKEDTFEEAVRQLYRIHSGIRKKLAGMGGFSNKKNFLTGKERLEILQNLLTPKKPFILDYKNLKNMSTKDIIAPNSIDFSNKNSFLIENRSCKVLFLKNFGTELNDAFLAELSKIQYPLSISIHVNIFENSESLKLIRSQIASMERQKINEARKLRKMNEGYYDESLLPEDLLYSLEEAKELEINIKKYNQKLFEVQFFIFLNCENENILKDVEKEIINIAKENNLNIGSMDFMQEISFQAALPLCYSKVPIQRTLPTSSLATFIPFTSTELMHFSKRTKYYGINAWSGNLILCDRTLLLNPAAWILGKPGGGKSFFAKKEIISILLNEPDSEIIVIDPENEYSRLAYTNDFCGKVVHINSESKQGVNPFEGNPLDKNFVSDKVEFSIHLISEMIGNYQITPQIISIIDRCARIVLEEYVKNFKKNPSIKTVHLLDIYNYLLKQQQVDERNIICGAMELFVKGSNSFFCNSEEKSESNRFTVYEIRDLGESLKKLAMLVILENIWKQIISNFKNGKKTYVYIDEAHLLLLNEYSRNYLKSLYKRARKYGAIITGITQNVEDLLEEMDTRTMLSNSEFIIMLNQSLSDRIKLQKLFNISDDLLQYISSNEEGSGLLFNGKIILPFQDSFPKNTELYNKITTNPDEI